MGKALLDQRRETADEVDTDSLGGAVHGLSDRYIRIGLAGIGRNGNRRYRNAFMNDRNAILRLDILTGFHEELCRFRNLVIDILAELVDIRMRAVTERDAHRDRTHVELVLRNHGICF